MRIAGIGARPPAADHVAGALSGAVGLLGQRPAVTALTADGRREQGFASLAGWVAKGANLLQLELGLGPGARIAVAGPPGWPLATVALSAWWIGATVVPAAACGGRADAFVLHVQSDVTVGSAAGDAGTPRFWFGDALDGTGPTASAQDEQWTDAVTPHGDRPPSPAAGTDLVALAEHGGPELRQWELLARLASEPDGVLGIVRTGDGDVLRGHDPATTLALLALRPLVTGAATVIVGHDDPDREAHAAAERITRWHG